jgi:hypothetical protein
MATATAATFRAGDSMAEFLNLTEEVRRVVAGHSDSTPLAALNPIKLTDGTYVLTKADLDNPAFAKHQAALAACPKVTITEKSRFQWYADDVAPRAATNSKSR